MRPKLAVRDAMAKQRRVDIIEKILRSMNGSARLQEVVDKLQEEERNPDVTYTSAYLAIQMENDKYRQSGLPVKFLTSKDGAPRGWVQLHGYGEDSDDDATRGLIRKIEESNRKIDESLLRWLMSKSWREFESSFLKEVLENLGFQDVEITQPTKDGGVDARVNYQRGIVKAAAIVSAKQWNPKSVIPVSHIQQMRGISDTADTGLIITTGKFSSEAKDEASVTGANQRAIYLIDGDMLVQVCKKHGIGVKRIKLPELIVLDEEVVGDAGQFQHGDNDRKEPRRRVSPPETRRSKEKVSVQRITKRMIGNSISGLSVAEVAKLTGYTEGTVRNYLSDGKRELLADKIRRDSKARSLALKFISERRAAD
ncbi:MAG: restriction endonuclease [Bryobacterales bacterium]|nr:restriction endonuclease [Bryobacterales bacterium]